MSTDNPNPFSNPVPEEAPASDWKVDSELPEPSPLVVPVVAEPTGTVEKPAKVAASSEKQECLDEIGAILKQYGNLESNIPPGHKYWDLLGKYRAL